VAAAHEAVDAERLALANLEIDAAEGTLQPEALGLQHDGCLGCGRQFQGVQPAFLEIGMAAAIMSWMIPHLSSEAPVPSAHGGCS
jgi:hypothetical protein